MAPKISTPASLQGILIARTQPTDTAKTGRCAFCGVHWWQGKAVLCLRGLQGLALAPELLEGEYAAPDSAWLCRKHHKANQQAVLHAAAHMPPEPRTRNSQLTQAESQLRAAVLAAAQLLSQQSSKRTEQERSAAAPADPLAGSDGEAAIPDTMLHLPPSSSPGLVSLVQPVVLPAVPAVLYEAGAPAAAATGCEAAPKPATHFKIKVRCWLPSLACNDHPLTCKCLHSQGTLALPLWLQFDTRWLDRMPEAELRIWAAKGRRVDRLEALVATQKQEISDLKAALKAAPFAQQLQVCEMGCMGAVFSEVQPCQGVMLETQVACSLLTRSCCHVRCGHR
jgi:hypothetical protein